MVASKQDEDKISTSTPEAIVRLSEIIRHLSLLCKRDNLTIGEFLHELNVYGHMLVCLIFSVPFLFPVPLPGLATVFGFLIILVSSQVLLGFEPWVPQSWRQQKISTGVLSKILEVLGWILQRTEKVIRPRLKIFAKHPGFVRVNAAVICLVAVLLALPMPPGFNAPPALAIVALAIGSLERDGAIVILGYVLSFLNMLLFGIFFVAGVEGMKRLIGG